MQGRVIWLTGLSGSGKSTIAASLRLRLEAQGRAIESLDGDAVREVFPQTGFKRADREGHVRRIGFLASRLAAHGVDVVAAVISPYEASRQWVRERCQNFFEIHVATPLAVCEARDVKGLYARARAGELVNFTGIDAPYECPRSPEATIDTSALSIEAAVDHVMACLERTR